MTDAASLDEPGLPEGEFSWHKLVDLDEVPEGRVSTVTIGHESLCVTHTAGGGYGCLGNAFNVEKGHVDIELICRDQKHIEQYMAWADKAPVGGESAPYGSGAARIVR